MREALRIVPRREIATRAEALSSPEPYLDADPEVFSQNFDRRDFGFAHRLAESPLFGRDALIDLTREMAKDPADLYYDAGDVRVEQRWNEVAKTKLTVNELLENIETESGWILLRRAEKVPEYAALLDGCMAEIEQLSGCDLRPLVAKRRALIFISSPHRISSYHIDRECNWLLQARGSKTVSVFRRGDRQVLPEVELERFWTVDNNAATYKPEMQHRAMRYELAPGRGVHIPVNAPHWVQNHGEVSVSLSVNFHYHDWVLGDVYRMNYWLRRAGLHPLPPFASPQADNIKRRVYAAARFVRRIARGKAVVSKGMECKKT
ncbi:MAG: transcriptional regulator [Candidatus Eremiobacteraeota bacterium]|nr:transcriptional regulator [Candidatus Eremiobacteraeota bacterium]